jgi:hypothetical protein
LLEPAAKPAGSRSNQTSGPLAGRRTLTSPGDQRVYRVKAGYLCGLCGRVQSEIETAFDCLSRCTIELRLRAPASHRIGGGQRHFNCTACGRGFANTDDAGDCFERCLSKLKPSPKFEAALRRVQARYVQRLQTHGTRPLERIDPISEHKQILAVLTEEQKASARPLGHSQTQDLPATASLAASSLNSDLAEERVSLVAHLQHQLDGFLGEDSIEKQDTGQIYSAANPTQLKERAESKFTIDESIDSFLKENSSEAQLDIPSSDQSTAKVPEREEADGSREASLESEMTDEFANQDGGVVPPTDAELSDGSGIDSNTLPTEPLSAEQLLSAVSPPDAIEDFALNESPAESLSKNAAADVLALLQTDEIGEGGDSQIDPSLSNSENKKTAIDTNLLDQLDVSTSQDNEPSDEPIAVRTASMKPYRRNNAKYCCSACNKEYFTKDQVEACFYSHPEEGLNDSESIVDEPKSFSHKTAA